ncbi:hypothetical protein BaRGS_00003131, partial [Batillaria attramentaria]
TTDGGGREEGVDGERGYVSVVTVTISTALEPPRAELRQPVVTEKFVERLCRLPLGGVVVALAYNVLLVLVCTVLAFKTRRLPDNYNESRYIAFCVDTTLLVWLTFVPAYFLATLAAHKVLVLALALLLNSSVHLSCLFIPRLYALYRAVRGVATPGDKPQFGSYGQIPLRTSSAAAICSANNARHAMSGESVEAAGHVSSTDVTGINMNGESSSDVTDSVAHVTDGSVAPHHSDESARGGGGCDVKGGTSARVEFYIPDSCVPSADSALDLCAVEHSRTTPELSNDVSDTKTKCSVQRLFSPRSASGRVGLDEINHSQCSTRVSQEREYCETAIT